MIEQSYLVNKMESKSYVFMIFFVSIDLSSVFDNP